MKKNVKSKNSEALEIVRNQSSEKNLCSFVNSLNSDTSSLRIDIEVGFNKELEQPLVKKLINSRTIEKFYNNLFKLKKDYSYESINSKFKSFFNIELNKKNFRTKEFNQYYFSEDLVESFQYRLKSLFKEMKKEFDTTKKLPAIQNDDYKFKLVGLRMAFPLKIKDEKLFEKKLFYKLSDFIVKNNIDKFDKFQDDLVLILIKSSKSADHNNININFFYDRETFNLTPLERKEKFFNMTAASIKFYFNDKDLDQFSSYQKFYSNFIKLLETDLSISYQYYLEKSIDNRSNYSFRNSYENLFLSNLESVKLEIKNSLKSIGIGDNLTKDEKVEISRLIVEILEE